MYTAAQPITNGPFGLAIAKVMSALRGDKYSADADPKPEGAQPAEPADSGGRPV